MKSFYINQKVEMSRKGQESFGEGGSVFRVPPYHYIHVQDQTSNVTRVEVGPLTFVSTIYSISLKIKNETLAIRLCRNVIKDNLLMLGEKR